MTEGEMLAEISRLRLEVERVDMVNQTLADQLLRAWAEIDELEHEAGA